MSYYKQVPDDFNVCEFGYERHYSGGGVSICRVLEDLHSTYRFSLKSLREKIYKEIYEDHCNTWYASRTSDIFLTPRERKVMPKHNNQWISHYFKM